MYYELYIDSLFLVSFMLNLILLCLINRMYGRTATRLRLLAAAAYGAGIHCVVFVLPVFALTIRLLLAWALVVTGMIYIAFRCKSIRQFGRMLPAMGGVMVFYGGFYYAVNDYSELINEWLGSGIGVLLTGIAAYKAGVFLIGKLRRPRQYVCKAVLETDMGRIETDALIDTGNLLTDPISKKPVSVLDINSVKILFGGNIPEYYRVVPYTSVGRQNGLLRCFEVPKMCILYQEEERILEKILIACADDFTTKAGCLIINPRLLMED